MAWISLDDSSNLELKKLDDLTRLDESSNLEPDATRLVEINNLRFQFQENWEIRNPIFKMLLNQDTFPPTFDPVSKFVHPEKTDKKQ